MTELMLRRSMAINPTHFDTVRHLWRRDMMRKAIKRDGKGRFARD